MKITIGEIKTYLNGLARNALKRQMRAIDGIPRVRAELAAFKREAKRREELKAIGIAYDILGRKNKSMQSSRSDYLASLASQTVAEQRDEARQLAESYRDEGFDFDGLYDSFEAQQSALAEYREAHPLPWEK